MRRLSAFVVVLVALSAMLLAATAETTTAPATAPAARPLRIVCFGDSITGDVPAVPYLDKYVKWTDLLGLMLEAKTGAAVESLNRGLAGDTTYVKPGIRGGRTFGAVSRVKQDILDAKPDIAVVLIGGNDKKATPEDRETTRKNLDQIVSETKAAGIKVLVLQYAVLGPDGVTAATRPAGDPKAPDADRTWYHLTGNNDLIAEIAKKHDVPTLELQPAFSQAVKTHPRAELVNTIDGVHLSPRGEMLLARTVFDKLVELGWVK